MKTRIVRYFFVAIAAFGALAIFPVSVDPVSEYRRQLTIK